MKMKKVLMLLVLIVLVFNLSLTVNAAPKLSKVNATMQVKKSFALKVIGTSKSVKWTSSNKSVAIVNQKGKVTAKKAGTCTISARVGKKTLKCRVNVKKKGTSYNVNLLYKNFLSQNTVKNENHPSYDWTIAIKDCFFTLVDINKDGTKELILKEKFAAFGPSSCSPVAYIYTIKNKKVVYAGSTCIKQDYSNTILISKKYKSIYSCYPVASYTPEYYYTIKNGKLSSVKFFYAQYGYGKDTYGDIPHETWCKASGYYIDKKKIIESKFISESKKYKDSLVKYTLNANTEVNRKKILG